MRQRDVFRGVANRFEQSDLVRARATRDRTIHELSQLGHNVLGVDHSLTHWDQQIARLDQCTLPCVDDHPSAPHGHGIDFPHVRRVRADCIDVSSGIEVLSVEERRRARRRRDDDVGASNGCRCAAQHANIEADELARELPGALGATRHDAYFTDIANGTHAGQLGSRLHSRTEQRDDVSIIRVP